MVYPCRRVRYDSQYHGLGSSMLLSNGGMGMNADLFIECIESLDADNTILFEWEAFWRDNACKFDELWDK